MKNSTPTGNRHFKAEQEVAYTDTFRRYLSGGLASLKHEDLELIARNVADVPLAAGQRCRVAATEELMLHLVPE